MASQVLGLRPANKIDLFLETRADALDRGDAGVYRAMCVELDRLGYVDAEPAAPAPSVMETAAVQAPERAVPPAKRRRGA